MRCREKSHQRQNAYVRRDRANLQKRVAQFHLRHLAVHVLQKTKQKVLERRRKREREREKKEFTGSKRRLIVSDSQAYACQHQRFGVQSQLVRFRCEIVGQQAHPALGKRQRLTSHVPHKLAIANARRYTASNVIRL